MNINILYIAIMEKFPNGSLAKSKYEFCKTMKITKRKFDCWIERKTMPSKYNGRLIEVLPNLDLNDLYKSNIEQ